MSEKGPGCVRRPFWLQYSGSVSALIALTGHSGSQTLPNVLRRAVAAVPHLDASGTIGES